jgi:hypothetical protein
MKIPRSVQFIDGPAFDDVKIDSVSIEAGNTIFEMINTFLIDIQSHKLIRSFSSLVNITIPYSLALLGSLCFSCCNLLSSITFESDSRLIQIESSAFSFSSLQSIVIPRSAELLCSSCFSLCKSLSSITIESDSRLTRIESSAFSSSSLQSIVIPRSVNSV